MQKPTAQRHLRIIHGISGGSGEGTADIGCAFSHTKLGNIECSVRESFRCTIDYSLGHKRVGTGNDDMVGDGREQVVSSQPRRNKVGAQGGEEGAVVNRKDNDGLHCWHCQAKC